MVDIQNNSPLFAVRDSATTYKTATVQVVDNITVMLSIFSLVWLIKGAYFCSLKQPGFKSLISFNLLATITHGLMDTTDRKGRTGEDEVFEVILTGEQLRLLITWITARIDHCERQRNATDPKVAFMFVRETMEDMKYLRNMMWEHLLVNEEV